MDEHRQKVVSNLLLHDNFHRRLVLCRHDLEAHTHLLAAPRAQVLLLLPLPAAFQLVDDCSANLDLYLIRQSPLGGYLPQVTLVGHHESRERFL